ncbi:MAG: hypothetical protein MUC60_06675 [Oscillatoria sp. Prado101]|jgi:WD40 repeat protein|nr:hypothetical protein [Oscillatoria sp. Prado101]
MPKWLTPTITGGSPDGQVLASGGDHMTVNLWNPHTGELFQTFSGHSDTDTIYSVVFISPDGKMLASCSFDKTIKIWQRG